MIAIVDWKVENTEYDPISGAISVVHWRATAIDETTGTVATVYGSVALDPNPDDPGFVPLAELTEPMVLDWAKRRLDVEDIETGLTATLTTLLDPPTITGLPWATASEGTPA